MDLADPLMYHVTVENEFRYLIFDNFGNSIEVTVFFNLKGFEKSKRYINVSLNLLESQNEYWKFIYEYKIHNIILLEDYENEQLVNIKIKFLANSFTLR